MKRIKLIIAFIVTIAAGIVPSESKAQVQVSRDYASFIAGTKGAVGATVTGSAVTGYLDTLANTDTTVYIVPIKGAKHTISFQIDVLKISGTVAGTIRLEGSVNGLTYETALVVSATTITDASVNYVVNMTSNKYQKYRLQVISSGTNTQSNRVYLLYREQP